MRVDGAKLKPLFGQALGRTPSFSEKNASPRSLFFGKMQMVDTARLLCLIWHYAFNSRDARVSQQIK